MSAGWIQWLGAALGALFLVMWRTQQKRIDKLEDNMVTHEDLTERENHYDERFNVRREAVQGEIKSIDKRVDDLREDLKAAKRDLTDEIRNSETRLLAAFTKHYRG